MQLGMIGLGRGVQIGPPRLRAPGISTLSLIPCSISPSKMETWQESQVFIALTQPKQSCERMTLNINSSPRNAAGHRSAAFGSKGKLGSHD
jgi:hypothetical protein